MDHPLPPPAPTAPQIPQPELTADERQILLDGCLMNYYAKRG